MERLQKYLAQSCPLSRRAGELAILAGRVQVNGQTVRRLGTRVNPGHDSVRLDGQTLRPKARLYVALNKPRGFVCSRRKQRKESLVAELLPAEWSVLHTVGRLDRESEGLLFLTNDGDFTLRLTHPRYGVPKTYLATVDGRITPPVLAKFLHGVLDQGQSLRAREAQLLSANASRSLVQLEIVEGKHHEVRRLFASQGFTVQRLIRTQIGCIRLGELKPGRWRVLNRDEVKSVLSMSDECIARAQADRTDRHVDRIGRSPSTCARL